MSNEWFPIRNGFVLSICHSDREGRAGKVKTEVEAWRRVSPLRHDSSVSLDFSLSDEDDDGRKRGNKCKWGSVSNG